MATQRPATARPQKNRLLAERLAIGVDIGGTKIAAGVVDEDGRILERTRTSTPTTDPDSVLDAIVEVTETLRENHVVKAIGIGAAGFVDATQSTVVFAPHLSWRNEPLRDRVARRTKLPVLVDNDANASGWAEWRFGAAQNEPDLVLITLGTGIGGAIVIDGQTYRGRYGIAGEFGHMRVVPDGRRCECGNVGCWEQYASGRVLSRFAAREVEADSALGRRLREVAGDLPVDGPHVTVLAENGDEACREMIAEVGHWLGIGMADLAAALDPGMFVIGGGASAAREMLLAPARASYEEQLTGRGFRPTARIVGAHLGPEAGLVGAADMARLTARRRRPASPGGRVRVRGAGRSGRSTRRRR